MAIHNLSICSQPICSRRVGQPDRHGYLIGLALAVRALFISGEKLARWAAAGGCLILFATPIGLMMAFLLIIGMAK